MFVPSVEYDSLTNPKSVICCEPLIVPSDTPLPKPANSALLLTSVLKSVIDEVKIGSIWSDELTNPLGTFCIESKSTWFELLITLSPTISKKVSSNCVDELTILVPSVENDSDINPKSVIC